MNKCSTDAQYQEISSVPWALAKSVNAGHALPANSRTVGRSPRNGDFRPESVPAEKSVCTNMSLVSAFKGLSLQSQVSTRVGAGAC